MIAEVLDESRRTSSTSTDLAPDELRAGLELAERTDLRRRRSHGLGVALIFEKPSNRTRQSMEMAVAQLGGHPVYTRGDEVGFDVREPVEDVTEGDGRLPRRARCARLRPRGRRAHGRGQHGADRQHAQRPLTPAAGPRRRADDAAGPRTAGRQDRRVRRRLQQRRPLARPRLGVLRRRRRARVAQSATTRRTTSWSA